VLCFKFIPNFLGRQETLLILGMPLYCHCCARLIPGAAAQVCCIWLRIARH